MDKIKMIESEIQKVIIGKNEVIHSILMAMLAKGHVLLEDVPGVGKTTLALAFSRAMSLDYKRMQFTPDVLPSDVTGFSMFNRKINDFEFKEGAVVCNLFLADELNRTSPKTQSALLESMEEGKVTVDGVTRDLPQPFFVLSTQNPVGSAGTQKLPESQMDRFMMKLSMGYPSLESEIKMLQNVEQISLKDVYPVVSKEEVVLMQKETDEVFVSESVARYIAEFVKASRESEWISLGISPRGAKAVLRAAKANAYMKGQSFVSVDDVMEVLQDVTGHRLVLSAKAKAAGKNTAEIIESLKGMMNVPVRR